MNKQEFEEKYPETFADIKKMTKEELLKEYISEVSDNEFFHEELKKLKKECKDIEFIVNLGLNYLNAEYPDGVIIIQKGNTQVLNKERKFV